MSTHNVGDLAATGGPSRRSERSLTALLASVALVAVVLAGGCASEEEPTANSTTTVDGSDGAEAASSAPGADGAASAGDESAAPGEVAGGPPTSTFVVDPSTPSTEYVPAKSGVPENPPTNGKGDPIVLDETALLACAQNQIAWVELQDGDPGRASDALKIAALRAGTSAVDAVKDASVDLAAAAEGTPDRAVVDEFLELCVDRGFEY